MTTMIPTGQLIVSGNRRSHIQMTGAEQTICGRTVADPFPIIVCGSDSEMHISRFVSCGACARLAR